MSNAGLVYILLFFQNVHHTPFFSLQVETRSTLMQNIMLKYIFFLMFSKYIITHYNTNINTYYRVCI